MAFDPIAPLSQVGPASVTRKDSLRGVGGPADPAFATLLSDGLRNVSDLEAQANTLTEQVASGDTQGVTDLMVAQSKLSLGVDLVNQVRNQAVAAYTEIMRLPV